ncbi:MAG: hypothetical protein NW214_01060 [Pseudanabaenaceae cyanobacterium bins.39]|nr:hypothetical protein [Pseudanabaenaceae cyanobacterium bins.39]
MKFSTLAIGFGIAAIAGSAFVVSGSEAATLVFSGGPNLVGDTFEFEFLPPTDGAIRSSLFVTSLAKSSVLQVLFTEPDSNNGTVTPNGVVTSTGWASTAGSYILGWGFKNDLLRSGSYPDTVFSNDANPVQFKLLGSAGGWYTYGIEDILGGGDKDYNDGTFKVRAVPVPAVVPGIALAGAFLGSKALKRNKKKQEEVAV